LFLLEKDLISTREKPVRDSDHIPEKGNIF